MNGYVESVGNLRDAVAQLTQNGMGGLENALTGLATGGKANFREFASSVLADAARMIIRTVVLKTILQTLMGGSGVASTFEMPAAAFIPQGGYGFAKGGVFGDVVSQPTLFRFANGGAMQIGLLGEAGTEAIMPLRRGRDGRLGVAATGGGVSVNVSVDASGTQVQGDAGRGEQLGRAVSQAVQAELIKQQRPGGLLAS